jgi:hypothetical protein
LELSLELLYFLATFGWIFCLPTRYVKKTAHSQSHTGTGFSAGSGCVCW